MFLCYEIVTRRQKNLRDYAFLPPAPARFILLSKPVSTLKVSAAFTGRPLSNSDMPVSCTRWPVGTTCSACRMALTLKWAETFLAISARDSDETVRSGPVRSSLS